MSILSESLPAPTGSNPLAMPSAEELAVESVSRLLISSYVSSLNQLPRPVLNEVGRRYVEGLQESDTLVWLGDEGHDRITRSSLNRWGQRFREVHKIVWSEWANRLLIARQAADNVDRSGLNDIIRNRVATLVAQEAMTSLPQDLDTNRLRMLIDHADKISRTEIEREKLVLAQTQAEGRALKLDVEVDKLRQAMRLEEARVAERVKALQSRIEELSTTVQRGRQVDPSIFTAIRAELTGLAPAPGREAV